MNIKQKKWKDSIGMLKVKEKKYRLDQNIAKHNGKLKYKCFLKIMKKDRNRLMNHVKEFNNYCKICTINPQKNQNSIKNESN